MISQGSSSRGVAAELTEASKYTNTHTRRVNGSNGSHSPSLSPSSSSLFIPQPINPDTFSPSFDIIWAINSNKEQYAGEKNLTLYNYSTIIKINVDRIRSQIKGTPGMHPVLSACLYGGLSQISAQEGIKELTELKLRFDSAPKSIPGMVSLAVGNFLSNFTIENIPRGKKINILIPGEHYGMLNRIAGDIGVAASSLAVLGMIHTIKDQQATNNDDRKEMEKICQGFYSAVDIRVRGARALMNEFQIPELRVKEKRKKE